MTSESLAKLYAEVVKVRPEAEVDMPGVSLFWEGLEDVDGEEVDRPGWFIGDDGGEFRPCGGEVPAAMILSHWLGMLPPNTAPMKRPDGKWRVVAISNKGEEHGWNALCGTKSDSQLESLAAYLKSTGTEGGA